MIYGQLKVKLMKISLTLNGKIKRPECKKMNMTCDQLTVKLMNGFKT